MNGGATLPDSASAKKNVRPVVSEEDGAASGVTVTSDPAGSTEGEPGSLGPSLPQAKPRRAGVTHTTTRNFADRRESLSAEVSPQFATGNVSQSVG